MQDAYVQAIMSDAGVQHHLSNIMRDDVSSSQAATLFASALTLAISKVQPAARTGRHRRHTQHVNPGKPWFDEACKQKWKTLHGLPRGAPETITARREYIQHIRRAKRAFVEQAMQQLVQDWYKSPRNFWQCYKSKHKIACLSGVPAWTDYFKGLYHVGSEHAYHGGSLATHTMHFKDLFPQPTEAHVQVASELNQEFTAEEVRRALGKLKDHKSAGVDGMPAQL
jgi:hypothetical protein